jgi:hypothetical protein
MADKLNAKRVGYSLAAVAGIIYLVCAILVAVAPVWTVSFFGALFHGIDITQIAVAPVSLANTILGLIEIIVLGFVAGWLFVKVYNSLK